LNLNLQSKNLIPVSKRVVNFAEQFAIGRVLSVAAAGEAQAHPWVRWGGLPGRRSHSSKTYWALGLISTVRIGAGAWRKLANTRQSGDTDQARTQIHGAQKGRRNRRKKDQKLLRKELLDGAEAEKPAHVGSGTPPLARATSLHSVAPRGQRCLKGKT
jgi:hypothetical protein